MINKEALFEELNKNFIIKSKELLEFLNNNLYLINVIMQYIEKPSENSILTLDKTSKDIEVTLYTEEENIGAAQVKCFPLWNNFTNILIYVKPLGDFNV